MRRRLLRLLDENSDDDDSAANCGDVDRTGYSVPTGDTQLPKLVFQMPHAVTRTPLETNLLNDAREPRKACPLAKTPPEIIRKMHADTATVLAEPAIRNRLEKNGLFVASSTPEEMEATTRPR